MLGFGFLMDDLTYIKEVRNLLYGSFLKFDVRLFNFTINNYFAFEKKIDKKLTRAEIIDKINNLMINNVKNIGTKIKNTIIDIILLLVVVWMQKLNCYWQQSWVLAT